MNKKTLRAAPHPGRLCAAIAGVLGILLLAAVVMPWHFPYDRLEHLYGIVGYETIPCGHPGGSFILSCAPINGSPKVELMVNGKVYTQAECIAKEQYAVTLGPELFAQPGELNLTLKETFSLPISLRSNTVRLYITQ